MSPDLDTQGTIGEDSWFSEVYAQVARGEMTGGVLVQSSQGDAAVFFREGRPVHAAGTGFTSHHLGTLLVELGACRGREVEAAVAKQGESPDPPLLGALLVADAGVNPADVKRAVQKQNEARFAQLFGWGDGTWTSAPGENARIRDVGVVTSAWPIFFNGLATCAADKELRALADRLLGRAVKVKGGGNLGLPDYEPGKLDRKLLSYLEKPRKPDHLERALRKRRHVRGLLRALELLDRLTILPASKGIAIPKASLVSMDLPGADHFRNNTSDTGRGSSRASSEAAPPPKPKPKPKRTPPIVKEVKALHAELSEKNHFELLGANEKTPPAELRKLYTVLAKKFHPDAFPSDVTDEIAVVAREVSAAINEAYQTLSSDEKRAEYLVLLSDHRIKGDVRRAEKVREAEMRAKMGVVMLRKRDYKQARDYFRFAMENDPETAEYKAHYAWACFADPNQNRADTLEEALPLLKEALAKNNDSAQIHYYMGQLMKASHKDRDALFHFKNVLRLDRSHADAKREVRLLRMRDDKRKEEESKKGAGLSRFFKKS